MSIPNQKLNPEKFEKFLLCPTYLSVEDKHSTDFKLVFKYDELYENYFLEINPRVLLSNKVFGENLINLQVVECFYNFKIISLTYNEIVISGDKYNNNEHKYGLSGVIEPLSCTLKIKHHHDDVYTISYYDDFNYLNQSRLQRCINYLKSFYDNNYSYTKYYVCSSLFKGIKREIDNMKID